MNFTKELLKFIAEHDLHDYLFWDEDLDFHVMCNDVFYWGTSDMELITLDSFNIFKECIDEIGHQGVYLYASKQRKLRPQGAFYKYIKKVYWNKFNACGNKRKLDFLNPNKIGE